ncbi:3459_t:CDS:2 [Entrophospora sp. SA101]|nr:3457_t:CDS:2 [Entrophospora sp. SA101]CAJ0854616.1 3459_t:CDS:2 [Entrophospora sp. SA101]
MKTLPLSMITNEEIIIINEEPIAESSQLSQRRKTNIEYLNDEEIISLVQFEEMGENGNDSSLDEEIPLILVKKCN